MSMRVISKILDMIIKKYGLSHVPIEILPPSKVPKKIIAKATGSSNSLTVSMSPELKEWCRDQIIVHGNMSAYVRFLIQLDMRGLIKPQAQQVIYQLPEGDIRLQPPNKNPNMNKNNKPIILGMNYGPDHGKMMDELKLVLKGQKEKIDEATP